MPTVRCTMCLPKGGGGVWGCGAIILTLISAKCTPAHLPGSGPSLTLFKSFRYLVMKSSHTDWARLYLSPLSWCQTVHPVNTATVYVITAPENQIDCVEGRWQTWCGAPEREKLLVKTGNDRIDQIQQFKQQDPSLGALYRALVRN